MDDIICKEIMVSFLNLVDSRYQRRYTWTLVVSNIIYSALDGHIGIACGIRHLSDD